MAAIRLAYQGATDVLKKDPFLQEEASTLLPGVLYEYDPTLETEYLKKNNTNLSSRIQYWQRMDVLMHLAEHEGL